MFRGFIAPAEFPSQGVSVVNLGGHLVRRVVSGASSRPVLDDFDFIWGCGMYEGDGRETCLNGVSTTYIKDSARGLT